jgi:hypothetical protein
MAKKKWNDEERLTEESVPVRCRVLQSCRFGEANDIAEVDSCELETAKALGFVDDDPGAVEYAGTLPQNAEKVPAPSSEDEEE